MGGGRQVELGPDVEESGAGLALVTVLRSTHSPPHRQGREGGGGGRKYKRLFHRLRLER